MGIPLKPTKLHPFARLGPYFGFLWDVQAKTATLLLEKASKYLDAVEEWRESATHTLKDVPRLYKKLLYALLVVLARRARLVGLERGLELAHCCPFAALHPPHAVESDLRWWVCQLRHPVIRRSNAIPLDVLDVRGYLDASTGTGIGITLANHWRAWTLKPGWKDRHGAKDIGWAKAVGFYILVARVIETISAGMPFRVYSDSEGAGKG